MPGSPDFSMLNRTELLALNPELQQRIVQFAGLILHRWSRPMTRVAAFTSAIVYRCLDACGGFRCGTMLNFYVPLWRPESSLTPANVMAAAAAAAASGTARVFAFCSVSPYSRLCIPQP